MKPFTLIFPLAVVVYLQTRYTFLTGYPRIYCYIPVFRHARVCRQVTSHDFGDWMMIPEPQAKIESIHFVVREHTFTAKIKAVHQTLATNSPNVPRELALFTQPIFAALRGQLSQEDLDSSGFPVLYQLAVTTLDTYNRAINGTVQRKFENNAVAAAKFIKLYGILYTHGKISTFMDTVYQWTNGRKLQIDSQAENLIRQVFKDEAEFEMGELDILVSAAEEARIALKGFGFFVISFAQALKIDLSAYPSYAIIRDGPHKTFKSGIDVYNVIALHWGVQKAIYIVATTEAWLKNGREELRFYQHGLESRQLSVIPGDLTHQLQESLKFYMGINDQEQAILTELR